MIAYKKNSTHAFSKLLTALSKSYEKTSFKFSSFFTEHIKLINVDKKSFY